MLQIALIGAGQLGSRHLQGLALLDRAAIITVVDPSEASLATARERFGQIAGATVKVRYSTSFTDLPASIDAAVVATGADVRRRAIEQLLERSNVRVALLEKVLFQKIDDYSAVETLLRQHGTHAWVNCAQRVWPFFRDLRPRTLGGSNLQVTVTGAQWGLGCNAIHNFDLLPFLTGDDDCRIEPALDPGSVSSKRLGFVEFTGTLYGFGARGNRVVQTSYRDGDAPIEFDLHGEDFHAIWRVADGTMRTADAASGWKWREEVCRVPFQSQLTHVVLAEMLDRGRSALPTYAESATLHVAMLRAFLEHVGSGAAEACPIT